MVERRGPRLRRVPAATRMAMYPRTAARLSSHALKTKSPASTSHPRTAPAKLAALWKLPVRFRDGLRTGNGSASVPAVDFPAEFLSCNPMALVYDGFRRPVAGTGGGPNHDALVFKSEVRLGTSSCRS